MDVRPSEAAKGSSSIDVRRADEGDLAGIASVRLALADEHEAHDDSGADPNYCRFLIADGHLLVAVDNVSDRAGGTSPDAGLVVGFAGAIDIDGPQRPRLLADLFIDPTRHGRGIGRALLDAVLAGSTARYTFSSADPAALPIYARAGMAPRWPLLYLRGPSPAATGPRLQVTEIDAADAARWEQSVVGADRSREYRYWAGRSAAPIVAVADDAGWRAVAALRVDADRVRIEHLCVVSLAPLDDIAAIAAWSSRPELAAYVPGHQQLAIDLLRQRFHVDDLDTYMASDGSLIDPAVAVVHPGLG